MEARKRKTIFHKGAPRIPDSTNEEPLQNHVTWRGISHKKEGQTLVEYALILLLVVLVAVVVVGLFGNRVVALFQSVVAVF